MEVLNWIFFGPAKLIAWYPYAGFCVGAAFLGAAAIRTALASGSFDRQWFRQPAVLAGLLWLLFNLYELQVAAVFAGQGDQAKVLFRMDLLVLAPILYTLTGLVVYQFWQAVSRKSDP